MSKFLMFELENLNVNLSMHPLLLRRTLYFILYKAYSERTGRSSDGLSTYSYRSESRNWIRISA